jgi:glycosyltransferase involved in cell wall biosynthesis
VFTHEILSRLAKKGYEVTLFTSEYEGCLAEEIIDQVRILRKGGKYTLYNEARRYCKLHEKSFDMIVDEINTRPFLTPKFVSNMPIIALFHQMAREFWFYETKFPLSYLGYYYLEKKWLSHYKNIPTVTVSESSKKDLEELEFNKVYLVPEGCSVEPLEKLSEKELRPTLIFVGRLKKVKLPHHALKAFSLIKRSIPDSQMWIVGEGYMKESLDRTSIPDVSFFGKVDNEKKYSLMKRAHLLLVPAVREGWGLVVTESNAMGTPAIAYDIPGLRDSVKHGETGLLVKNNPDNMAEAAISLLRDRSRLKELSENALHYSREFSWDKTADEFEKVIKMVMKESSL